MSRVQNKQKQFLNQANLAWRYALLAIVLVGSGPVTHFVGQALRGHPLDPHYFLTEFSPERIFNPKLYNGKGGADWKIGKPLASIWNSSTLRSLPEARKFALELVNRDRAINGLLPLTEDPLLSAAAQLHAQDMLDRQYFDHVSPDGKNPRDRFLAVGGSPQIGVGENILRSKGQHVGITYGELEESQRGWMYSNGHRENLLTPEYTQFGYGIVIGPGGQVYAVQMFALPEQAAPSN